VIFRALGVDPGTAVTGYGIVEGRRGTPGRLIECGVVRPGRGTAMPARLETLYDGVRDVLANHKPDVVAVESIFYSKNVRTSLMMSHARGVILLAAAQAGLPVAEFAPAAVKKAVVGRGRATKTQVALMVQQLLRLRRPPQPADAADGVAIALAFLLLRPA